MELVRLPGILSIINEFTYLQCNLNKAIAISSFLMRDESNLSLKLQKNFYHYKDDDLFFKQKINLDNYSIMYIATNYFKNLIFYLYIYKHYAAKKS